MAEEALRTSEAVEGTHKAGSLAGKYLTFVLGGETYGLEILKVQEIIGLMDVTEVPQTPDFVRGVVNLRGKVIPVVDMHRKFGLTETDDTELTCIIVVQVVRESGAIVMGVIVDEVSEVLDIEGSQIEPPPSFGASVDTSFILGMGKVGDTVMMLLDLDRVLSGEDLDAVREIA
ncbi:purine-binding chemotaxis protein CheW [bacterium]|nr:purine-binding chemotaxis protein CheW [bacterium]